MIRELMLSIALAFGVIEPRVGFGLALSWCLMQLLPHWARELRAFSEWWPSGKHPDERKAEKQQPPEARK